MGAFQELLPVLDTTSAVAIVLVIGWLVITRKLIWHKDLEKSEEKALRWERVALEALGVADKLTIQGEVTTEVLTKLPEAVEDRQPGKHEGGTQ